MDAAERNRLVRRLFDEALAKPAGEREAFVRGACGADRSMGDEVLSLLVHDAETGGIDLTRPRRRGRW